MFMESLESNPTRSGASRGRPTASPSDTSTQQYYIIQLGAWDALLDGMFQQLAAVAAWKDKYI